MFTIGLTGGVGTGKSTVAKYLVEKYKFAHVDADVLAKEVFEDNYGTIISLDVDHKWSSEGTIDRKKLFLSMLSDLTLKEKIETIIHPQVRSVIPHLTSEYLLAGRNVLLDVPLLFESGLARLCTKVFCVTCSEEEQIRRVKARSGYSEDLIHKIIDSQISNSSREQLSDVVLRNEGDLSSLYDTIDTVMTNFEFR